MAHLGIIDLLKLFGFTPARSKLVRHIDKRYDVQDLIRRGWFEAYQSTQARPVFDNLDRIVSLIGLEGSRALLIGVYSVGERKDASLSTLPPGCPYVEWVEPGKFYYDLNRVKGFESLENRLVVDWGPGALAWHQKTTNKVVTELRPRGSGLTLFNDYLEFTLTYRELKSLFETPDLHSEWRARLAAVAGVYLILASSSGRQYVGSAYGSEGIWGRWAKYAATGHGGNVELKKMMELDSSYPDQFTFSILQILPLTTTRERILKWEARHKAKLGTLATGLNGN